METALRRVIQRAAELLSFALVLHCLGHAPACAQNIVRVTPEQKITANIADLPLGQVLALLSEKVPLDVQGNAAAAEQLSMHVSGLTLQEALKEILTGYNYVLITPEKPSKPILIILGKAEKSSSEVQTKRPEEPGTGARNLAAPGEARAEQPGVASLPSTEIISPSPITAASLPVQPLPTIAPATIPPPTVAGGQGAASAQNPSADASTSAAATADSQIPFNPAAWGGRGYTGRGRK